MSKRLTLRVVSVVVLVAMLALAAMPVAAQGPAVLIYGRVRDITNDKGLSVATPAGDPVDAAAVVELVKPSGAVVSSTAVDYNGDFLFNLPVQPGVYTLRVASIPTNYGATLVGTRLNPDKTIPFPSMLAAAFIPGIAQVPVLVIGGGWYGFVDFEYTAGAKPDEVCNTPAWSYIHGFVVTTVLDDGLPVEAAVAGMPLQLMKSDGAGGWVNVYRPSGDRVFFSTTDRGLFGVGIRYSPGVYGVFEAVYAPGDLPLATIALNACGTDNNVGKVWVP